MSIGNCGFRGRRTGAQKKSVENEILRFLPKSVEISEIDRCNTRNLLPVYAPYFEETENFEFLRYEFDTFSDCVQAGIISEKITFFQNYVHTSGLFDVV